MEHLKNKRSIGTNLIIAIISSVVFLLMSIANNLVLQETNSYKLDFFVSNVYEKSNLGINPNPVIYSVHQNKNQSTEKYIFNNLLETFYYNMNVSNVRCCVGQFGTSYDLNIHLETQDKFYTQISENGSIYLDYGLYTPYFLDSDLTNRNYEGCDTFVYVSDTFVNKLLDFNGITIDGDVNTVYKNFLLNNDINYIVIETDNSVSIKARIVNILFFNKRNGPRTYELYGDFGLIYLNNNVNFSNQEFRFEIDLKNNQLCIQNTLNSVKTLGYNLSNSIFTFRIFDGLEYLENFELNNMLVKTLDEFKDDTVFYCLFFSFALVEVILTMILSFLLSSKYHNFNLFLFAGFGFSFIICGITASFISWPPFFSITPLILLILTFVLSAKEIYYVYKIKIAR